MNDDHAKECRVNNKLDCFGAIWNDYCRRKPRNSASICPTTKNRNRKQPLIYCWFEGWTLTIEEFIFFCFCPFFKDQEGKSVFIVKTLLNTFVPISSFFHDFIQSKKPKIFCHLLTICMVSLPLIMGVCFHNFNLNWIQWNWWKRWYSFTWKILCTVPLISSLCEVSFK